MKILAHINNLRFILKENNKFYLVSIPKKQIFMIENPDMIYRQGYWEPFKGKLEKEKREAIASLIHST